MLLGCIWAWFFVSCMCVYAVEVDHLATHGLSCCRRQDQFSRHASINAVIKTALDYKKNLNLIWNQGHLTTRWQKV